MSQLPPILRGRRGSITVKDKIKLENAFFWPEEPLFKLEKAYALAFAATSRVIESCSAITSVGSKISKRWCRFISGGNLRHWYAEAGTIETLTINAEQGVRTGNTISVAVIEDNRLLREGICALLNQLPDFRVVGNAARGDTSLLIHAASQVVLLDLGLRNGDSLRFAKRVRAEFREAKIILMDVLPVHEDLVEFVNAGVSGFIMKDATVEELASTIRSVAAGGKVLPSQMTGTLFSQIAKEAVGRAGRKALSSVRMTAREKQVINFIAEGLSNKEIADRLHIATHTVKSHVRNVMEKLMLHTRLQIAAYAHDEPAGVVD